MAAEQVNIASLTIDINDVEKQSVELKKTIDSLRKAQKALDTSTEEGAAAYEALNSKIKNTTKQYRDNQKFATALDKAEQDLTKTLNTEGKSVQQLRDDRAALNQISKQIKGDTDKEIEQREKLNAAIDAQTEKIKELSPGYVRQKEEIGAYTDGINAADFNLRSLILKSEEAGGATNLLSGGIKAATQGMFGFIKASLAFIATPVGIVLAAIAAAFLLIQNAMNRSEDATNKIQGSVSGLTGIFQGLLKALEPLGNFLVDVLVGALELVEKGITSAMKGIASALKFLGFEETAASLDNFNKSIEDSIKVSKELTVAELNLQKAQRQAEKIQLDYQRAAEKLRQTRDDETKTIAERIKANEDLAKTLDEQAKKELEIAKQAENVAKLRIQLNGETTEALDELAEAQLKISDIEERIEGQRSEQLTNRVALQKEAVQLAIDAQNAELDAYLKSQEVRKKSLEEEVQLEREAAERRKKIAEDELEAKLISQREYDARILEIQTDLLKKQAELTADNARRELDSYIQNNQSKLDSDKFLSEEAFREEQRRLDGIAEKRREAEAKELAAGTISQQDFNDAINQINEENRLANEELEKEREEARKEKEALDFENKLALMEEQNLSEFEVLTAKLEAERLAEVKEAEKTGADIELINKKFAARQKSIDTELNKAKLSIYADTFGGIAQLLGEQTAAGKAAGIAQATINTYQGVTEVWKAPSILPEPFNTATKIVATGTTLVSGLGAVKKIAGTPTQFSKGDILKGRSHAQGGIPFSIGGMLGFEAEGGEALINKKSTAMYKPLLSAINVAGGGRKFQAGGIAGSTTNVPTGGLFNYDILATRIAEANENLPAPVVSVLEIQEVANNVAVVEDLATS